MRITEQIRVSTALSGEETSSSRLNDLTRMSSTGVKVDAPSQDPAAYARIVNDDGQITRLTARQSTLDLASGNLNLADTSLSSASDLVVQAHSLALQMSNGSETAADRASAAQQITGIRQQLLAIANTQGPGGTYIFGGTKTGSAPFDATTGAFSGNDGVINVEVADGVTAASNASGAKAFTAAGGSDVFADLDALSTALSANDVTGITSSVSQLDADRSQVVGARVNVGIMTNRLTSASDVIGNTLTQVKTARSADADIDAPTVLSELTATQTAYEQALAVTKQILSLSSFRIELGRAGTRPAIPLRTMLIVQRRVGERITIGEGIEVTIQSTTRGGVRLAIVAPRGVTVLRGEVHDAIAKANAAAIEQSQSAQDSEMSEPKNKMEQGDKS